MPPKGSRKSAPVAEVKKATTKTTKEAAASTTKKALKPLTNGSKHNLETDDATMAIKKLKLTPTTSVLPSREKKEAVAESKAKSAPKTTKAKKTESKLSTAPTRELEIYVFGGNSGGELGLGPGQKAGEVARPKLNPHLSTAGVVQVAAGGMHGVALTADNKVITWGVNDQGALGRDTKWDGGLVEMKDADASDSDSESDAGLNPRECTPTEIDMTEIPEGTVFTQVVAGDNATFALTDKGLVYGWGTFRVSTPRFPAINIVRINLGE
jgi:regulator of chromosome condensation